MTAPLLISDWLSCNLGYGQNSESTVMMIVIDDNLVICHTFRDSIRGLIVAVSCSLAPPALQTWILVTACSLALYWQKGYFSIDLFFCVWMCECVWVEVRTLCASCCVFVMSFHSWFCVCSSSIKTLLCHSSALGFYRKLTFTDHTHTPSSLENPPKNDIIYPFWICDKRFFQMHKWKCVVYINCLQYV